MAYIITVINQKGGVGKSTTAHALGTGLLQKGYKVLFIDLDPQCNLTYIMQAQLSDNNSFELLKNQTPIQDCIQVVGSWHIVASSPQMTKADIEITELGKEYRLKEALQYVSRDYDFIIMDTPPALGIVTINALTACTGAMIPAQADIMSLQGIGQLNDTINAVRQYSNPDLQIMGILLTRYNNRNVLTREFTDVMRDTAQKLQTILYPVCIRECVAIKEAQAQRQSIFDYAPKSNAADDYGQLLNYVLKGMQVNA